MGLITKDDVKETVIKLHRAGKSYPSEYVQINKCKTQEEINQVYMKLVVQLTESIWDWFFHSGLPRKDTWEKATYKAMGLRGDITAELMINAIREVNMEHTTEVVSKAQSEKNAPLQSFSPLTSDDKLCNWMLWSFTRTWLGKRITFGDYKISTQEIECEMDRLGIPVGKRGLKRRVVEAGLMQRAYNKEHNITEELLYQDGVVRTVPKRVISVCKGVPVIWGYIPQTFLDSIDGKSKEEIWLKLL